jgi:hypothetical protein
MVAWLHCLAFTRRGLRVRKVFNLVLRRHCSADDPYLSTVLIKKAYGGSKKAVTLRKMEKTEGGRNMSPSVFG